jgi:hypothetical protein
VEVNENENEGLNWSQSGCLHTLLDVIYWCLCLRFIWPESLELLTVIKVEFNIYFPDNTQGAPKGAKKKKQNEVRSSARQKAMMWMCSKAAKSERERIGTGSNTRVKIKTTMKHSPDRAPASKKGEIKTFAPRNRSIRGV